MANTPQWWNRFWADREADDIASTIEADTWLGLVWKVTLESWHERFEQLAPGKMMLECGCGTAKVSQYMALRGYHCTMLDYSEDALSLARVGFHRIGRDGHFVIGDINQLGVANERYDIVYTGGVLEFFSNIERPIAELVRVLRPGGLFAANMVPRKFSVQTLGDAQRVVALGLKRLFRVRAHDAINMVRSIPRDYQVNRASLDDYIMACGKAGLGQVKALVTSPFPSLSLPRSLARSYARCMRALIPQWRHFNETRARWKDLWGITYTIYGIKQ